MTWTPERRAAQAARCRANRPWEQSTGPKTASGKARCAQNARKHGHRSVEAVALRHILKMQRRFIKSVLNGNTGSFLRTEALTMHFALLCLPALERQLAGIDGRTKAFKLKNPVKSMKLKAKKRK